MEKIMRVGLIIVVISFLIAGSSFVWTGLAIAQAKFNYCEIEGYDGVSDTKIGMLSLDSESRCYKRVNSNTGVGYEIKNSGIINGEDLNIEYWTWYKN